MKKLILVTALTVSLAGLSAFGQGYFQFTTAKSQVWDGFSGGPSHPDTTVNVAFLWAANGSIPTVATLMSSVPFNMTVATASYYAPVAWYYILTDPNFTLAVNNANSQVAVAQSSATGAVNYNSGFAFAVQGTTVGTSYRLFMIGWYSAYATPSLAAAAASVDGYVGWSAPFAYTSTALTSSPTSFAGLTGDFGVAGPVPEPSAFALAGLGSLALWLFRRRR